MGIKSRSLWCTRLFAVAVILLLSPLLLSAQQQTNICDTASEAGKGIVTNDCVVCVPDGKGGKEPVGAKCEVSGGGADTNAACQPDPSEFAGQCKVTYISPDGKTLTARETSKPSPRDTSDLKKIYDSLVGEGSQAYVPKELNTGPSSAWLGEIDKAFAQPTAQTPTEIPQTTSAADELQRLAIQPEVIGEQKFDITAYAPCRSAADCPIQGGPASSIRGPDGTAIVRTLDDYRLGRSDYVTGASDPSRYGETYVISEITYRSPIDGKEYTLQDVPVAVHDTGSAFRGRPDKLDIALSGGALSDAQAAQWVRGQEFLATRYQTFSQIAGLPSSPPTLMQASLSEPALTQIQTLAPPVPLPLPRPLEAPSAFYTPDLTTQGFFSGFQVIGDPYLGAQTSPTDIAFSSWGREFEHYQSFDSAIASLRTEPSIWDRYTLFSSEPLSGLVPPTTYEGSGAFPVAQDLSVPLSGPSPLVAAQEPSFWNDPLGSMWQTTQAAGQQITATVQYLDEKLDYFRKLAGLPVYYPNEVPVVPPSEVAFAEPPTLQPDRWANAVQLADQTDTLIRGTTPQTTVSFRPEDTGVPFFGASSQDVANYEPITPYEAPPTFADNLIPPAESFVQTGEQITQQFLADIDRGVPVPESFVQSGEEITSQIASQNEIPQVAQLSEETTRMLSGIDSGTEAKFDNPPNPLFQTEQVVSASDERRLEALQARADAVRNRTANIANIVTNPTTADVQRLGREVDAAAQDLRSLEAAARDAQRNGIITREEYARIAQSTNELRGMVNKLAENRDHYTLAYQDTVRSALAGNQADLALLTQSARANTVDIARAIPTEPPARAVSTMVASSDYIPTGPAYYAAVPPTWSSPFQKMFAYSGSQDTLSFADLPVDAGSPVLVAGGSEGVVSSGGITVVTAGLEEPPAAAPSLSLEETGVPFFGAPPSADLADYIDYEAGIDVSSSLLQAPPWDVAGFTEETWSHIAFEDDAPETRSIPAYTPEELIAQQVGPTEPAVQVNLPDIEPATSQLPSSVSGATQASLPSVCLGASASDCVTELGGNWSTERTRLAGIIGCTAGTASCNTQILNAIRQSGGLPVPLPPSRPSESNPYATAINYRGDSIVRFLEAADKPSDYASRAELARTHGITNYRGTAAQNIQLLAILRATIR